MVSSFNILNATPLRVVGAGVVGIFKGAGIFAYSQTLYATPNSNTAVAR